MGKYLHRTLDIYDAELYLATDLDQWRSLRRKVDGLEKKPAGIGYADLLLDEDHLNTPRLPIFIDVAAHGDDGPALVNTCAHEATHAGTLLLEHIGQPVSGEACAYLIGWLTAWLWLGCAD